MNYQYVSELELPSGLCIECQLDYNFTPAVPMHWGSTPEDADPGSDSEIYDGEIKILDTWLSDIINSLPEPKRKSVLDDLAGKFIEQNRDAIEANVMDDE